MERAIERGPSLERGVDVDRDARRPERVREVRHSSVVRDDDLGRRNDVGEVVGGCLTRDVDRGSTHEGRDASGRGPLTLRAREDHDGALLGEGVADCREPLGRPAPGVHGCPGVDHDEAPVREIREQVGPGTTNRELERLVLGRPTQRGAEPEPAADLGLRLVRELEERLRIRAPLTRAMESADPGGSHEADERVGHEAAAMEVDGDVESPGLQQREEPWDRPDVRIDLWQAWEAGERNQLVNVVGEALDEPSRRLEADQADPGAGLRTADSPQGGNSAEEVAESGQGAQEDDRSISVRAATAAGSVSVANRVLQPWTGSCRGKRHAGSIPSSRSTQAHRTEHGRGLAVRLRRPALLAPRIESA